MPTISNPYGGMDSSGIGKSLEDLGNSIFGPQAATAEYAKQKAADARRVNQSKDFIQRYASTHGGNVDVSDPNVAAAISGLDDPSKYFQGHLGIIANRYGATDPRTSAAQIGAGGSIGATQTGLGQTLGSQQMIAKMNADKAAKVEVYKADNTPINVVGPQGPQIVSRSAAIHGGMQPVLGNSEATGYYKQKGFDSGYENFNDEQKKASDSYLAPDHVMNYITMGPNGQLIPGRTVDGKTDMTTGKKIPQQAQIISASNPGGTNAFTTPFTQGQKEQSDARQTYLDNKDIVDLTNHAMAMVRKDPTIVGAPGQIQNHVQNALGVARDVANKFGQGQTLDQSLRNMQVQAVQQMGNAAAQKAIPELFGPYKSGVNDLQAIHAILTYKAASALFGQSGRDLSDRDVAAARALVGDPASWMQSADGFMATMANINRMAAQRANNAAGLLGSRNVTQPQAPANYQPVQAQQPAQQQPPAQQLAPGGGSPGLPPIPQPAGLSSHEPLDPAIAPQAAPVASAGGNDVIAEGKAAIARGANPQAVMQRIQALLMGQQPQAPQ